MRKVKVIIRVDSNNRMCSQPLISIIWEIFCTRGERIFIIYLYEKRAKWKIIGRVSGGGESVLRIFLMHIKDVSPFCGSLSRNNLQYCKWCTTELKPKPRDYTYKESPSGLQVYLVKGAGVDNCGGSRFRCRRKSCRIWFSNNEINSLWDFEIAKMQVKLWKLRICSSSQWNKHHSCQVRIVRLVIILSVVIEFVHSHLVQKHFLNYYLLHSQNVA